MTIDDQMFTTFSFGENIRVVKPLSECRISTDLTLRNAVSETHPGRYVLLDMTDCGFMTREDAIELAEICKKANGSYANVIVLNPNLYTTRLFTSVQAERVIPLYSSLRAAKAAEVGLRNLEYQV